MSYAGPVNNRSPKPPAGATNAASRRKAAAAKGKGWEQVAVFGAGVALGITLGAVAALLSAPRSGSETRELVRGYAGRRRRVLGRRTHDAWLELKDELSDLRSSLRRRNKEQDAAGGDATSRPPSPSSLPPDTSGR